MSKLRVVRQNEYGAPRRFDDEERMRLRQKQIEKRKHKARRAKIIGFFSILFVILGIQIAIKTAQTNRIRQEVQASKVTLAKLNKEKEKLNDKYVDLKDPDYVAKLIRYRFYYSKPNETIYNVPEGK
ncbi:FtsB family cell division protein [Lactobacillus pasteurii]|uniref:Possible septum formation initiator protein n=1 Tax=Lactobacillus pasteurii DSM 23907 = CRBIP 24.76 TaxID=1423790 RepID=I7JY16_9LACO|nr:septum formation initiator family protein [Lactobacillus pasteurii]TDG75971.1 hypothetical protein C5L33_001529 [Lactobacillus pasteurii]CCI85140.1 Possible septum formation initiator protein [Lactobacillus pasteurii DSM 23907 = CRBIP 24.76]